MSLYGDAFNSGIWADLDSAMSDSSRNPVENRVIKAYVDAQSGATVDSAMSSSSANAVQNQVIKSYVDTGLSGKQDTLTFDNAPTASSTNPVKSEGIKTYVDSAISGVLGDLATVESSTIASQNYAVGDYLVYNNTLYKVTVAIASGGTITPGTNCSATTAGDELSALNSDLRNYITIRTFTTSEFSLAPNTIYGASLDCSVSGYTPLGLVGWIAPDTSVFTLTKCVVSSSGKINYTFGNFYTKDSQTRSTTVTFYILYRKS